MISFIYYLNVKGSTLEHLKLTLSAIYILISCSYILHLYKFVVQGAYLHLLTIFLFLQRYLQRYRFLIEKIHFY